MRFQVVADGEPRVVELAFGTEQDLVRVNRWCAPVSVAKRPGVRDTVEFARLATKRWRYYRRSIATATSFGDLDAIVTREPHAEVSLLLLVRADWFKRSTFLGLPQCRRTYCHHLIIEFLAVHPAIVGGAAPRVRGVGSGLVCGLCELAGAIGVQVIWGEATAYSAPFYAHTLGVAEVLDHFFIRDKALENCRLKFRDEFQGELD